MFPAHGALYRLDRRSVVSTLVSFAIHFNALPTTRQSPRDCIDDLIMTLTTRLVHRPQAHVIIALLLIHKHRRHTLHFVSPLALANHLTKTNHEIAIALALTIPLPTHILVTNTFFFSLFASLNAVAICLAPVHPNG